MNLKIIQAHEEKFGVSYSVLIQTLSRINAVYDSNASPIRFKLRINILKIEKLFLQRL